MALQLLTLRPPPNVDFISGFPGLAPGPPDRPHAAVIGTLEVRTPQPIKAKYVHVELRKIESVPGAAPFIDTIGSKPTVVWEPQGSEFGILQSQDFYFSIRIPESAPPTVSLDNGRAGIRYELIATMCGKGKRSLLGRGSSPLQVTSTEIIILKHEMHATWPVYAQPDERNTSKDGMTLTVSRRKTCLGAANDHIMMQAVLRTDVPISLRSFELALVQKLAYPNSGGNQPGRKGAVIQPPPARSSLISEQKRPINARIQPGMHQACELTCMLPPNYTAMTVATARLIENTYEVHVSAMLEGGGSISIGMPITVSPFPIAYSMEMMQRIGMPPMALDDPSRAHLHQQISRPASAASHAVGSATMHGTAGPNRQMRPYQIAERVGGQVARDDTLLGGPPSPKQTQVNMAGTLPIGQIQNGRQGPPTGMNTYPPPADMRGPPGVNEFGQPDASRPVDVAAGPTSPPAFAAPAATTTSRFAVVNATQRDELDSPRSSRFHEPQLTAAEEKQRLREQQMNDATSYASVPPPGGPPPAAAQPHLNGAKQQNPDNAGGTSSTRQNDKPKWESAEQEKQRLFESARNAAELTQRRAMNTSIGGGSITKGTSPKTAKQFAEAQSTPTTASSSLPTTAPASSSSNTPGVSPAPTQKTDSNGSKKWMPAEEEKRKLYEKAQARALKTQARAASAASGGAGVGRSNSTTSNAPSVNGSILNPYAYQSTVSSGLKGADLYKSAMNNVRAATPGSPAASLKQTPLSTKPELTPPPVTPPAAAPVPVATTVTPPPPVVTPPSNNNKNWLSAEDEKARLRYLDAKRAVEQHVAAQEDDYNGSSGYGNSSYNAASGSSQAGYASPPTSTPGYSSPPPTNLQPWSTPANVAPPTIAPTPPPPANEPPPFEPSFGYTHATDIPEKEKMKLAMAQRDAAPSQDLPDYTMPPSGPPPSESIPSYGTVMTPEVILSATEEKARLRAQFAAQDALTAGAGSSSASGSGSSAPPASVYSRPPAETPMSADGSRSLTAAEEKARLLALQNAARPLSSVAPAPPPPRIKSPPPSAPLSAISEHSKSGIPDYNRTPAISTTGSSSSSDINMRRDPSISQGKQRVPSNEVPPPFVAPPPPPPLAPRPPVEYIQQTKEEDMKIRRMTQEAVNQTVYGEKSSEGAPWLAEPFLSSSSDRFSLGLRPFSPLDLSLDTSNTAPNGYSASTPSSGQRSAYYR